MMKCDESEGAKVWGTIVGHASEAAARNTKVAEADFREGGLPPII